jgi:hypothetical protein
VLGGEENSPGPRRIVSFHNYSKISSRLELIRSKDGLSKLENFQIKYLFEGVK